MFHIIGYKYQYNSKEFQLLLLNYNVIKAQNINFKMLYLWHHIVIYLQWSGTMHNTKPVWRY